MDTLTTTDPIYQQACKHIDTDKPIDVIVVARTVRVPLARRLLNVLKNQYPQAEIILLTTHDSPPIDGIRIVRFPFGPYFEAHITPASWYADVCGNKTVDLLVLPYPGDTLSGLNNVKRFLTPFAARHLFEIGSGGLHQLSGPAPWPEPDQIDTVSGSPASATFNITEHCNLRCVMCDIDDENDYPHMPYELFVKLGDQILPRCRTLTLNGFVGEPMLHPDFDKIINTIDERWPQLSVEFATNGTALTEHKSQLILNSKTVTDLRFSLHAVNPDTMEAVMLRANAERLMRNVRRFMAMKKESSRDKEILITFSFVAMQQNISELVEFVHMAAELGADRVLVWDVQISQASNFDYSLHDKREMASDVFAEAKAAAEKQQISLVFSRDYTQQETLTPDSAAFRCQLPWTHVYVSPNGEVSPCCYYHHVIGDLSTTTFDNIWNNSAYRELRTRMHHGDYPLPCRSCPENRDSGVKPQIVQHKNQRSNETVVLLDKLYSNH